MVIKVDDGRGPGLVPEETLDDVGISLEGRWGGGAASLSLRVPPSEDLGEERHSAFAGSNRITSYEGATGHLQQDPSMDVGEPQPSSNVVDLTRGEGDIAAFRTNQGLVPVGEEELTRMDLLEPDESVTFVDVDGRVRFGDDLLRSALMWLEEVDPERN